MNAIVLFLLASSWMTVDRAPTAPPKIVYIKAGRLFDGTGDSTLPDRVIVVEGEKINEVGSSSDVKIPNEATVIDLSGATILPGLIDAHTHLSSRADRYDEINKFKDTPNHGAFAAVLNAKKTLEAGFTTVRDVGSRPFLAVDLRDAIDEGFLVGPRVVASGPGISITGGHGDLNKFAPQVRVSMFPEEHDYKIADGIDQVRHVVRAQIKHGVDLIKVNASGGVLSRGDSPGAPQYSVEELRVLVEEAHAAGRKVAAHAHGAQGIKNAVIAGVDSIEHGSLIDDEGIKLMIEKGTWLVADIYNDDYLLGKAVEFHLPQESIDKEKAIGQLQRDNFARAAKAGVKIAYGTDAGVYPHGDNGKQFFYMVKYGLTPAHAIRSATSDAAELLGKASIMGKVAPGFYADLIAVVKDPLADVQALESVGFVMKGGVVVKDEIRSQANHPISPEIVPRLPGYSDRNLPSNLLVNGSFEEGPEVFDFLAMDEGSTDIRGWKVTRGQIDYLGDHWKAADGNRSLDLHGSPGYGGVEQTFKTTTNQRYRVTLAMAGSPGCEYPNKSIIVSAAGKSQIFAFDSTGKTTEAMGWLTKEWEFEAVADQTTLEIRTAEERDPVAGPALDEIRVEAIPIIKK